MERLIAQLAPPSFIFNGDVEISLPICNYQLKKMQKIQFWFLYFGVIIN